MHIICNVQMFLSVPLLFTGGLFNVPLRKLLCWICFHFPFLSFWQFTSVMMSVYISEQQKTTVSTLPLKLI